MKRWVRVIYIILTAIVVIGMVGASLAGIF